MIGKPGTQSRVFIVSLEITFLFRASGLLMVTTCGWRSHDKAADPPKIRKRAQGQGHS
ncbi:hypothetical protein SAMD00023353_2700260 [Rosellinia necatrix]|uniref:Uncharacterized protein n=1 Tax=Rosellinia necatrix TaxID=77044 RepID=A0A1S8A8B3_ROSNE|nr:hypothetical protein SAMD00023353_2700260 [Rosellinia necatrix]